MATKKKSLSTENQSVSTADDQITIPNETRVKFRVTPKTWIKLHQIAKDAGMNSIHDYARKLVLDYTQIKSEDLIEINNKLAQCLEMLTSINTTLIAQLDYMPTDIIELNDNFNKIIKKQTKIIRRLK